MNDEPEAEQFLDVVASSLRGVAVVFGSKTTASTACLYWQLSVKLLGRMFLVRRLLDKMLSVQEDGRCTGLCPIMCRIQLLLVTLMG